MWREMDIDRRYRKKCILVKVSKRVIHITSFMYQILLFIGFFFAIIEKMKLKVQS